MSHDSSHDSTSSGLRRRPGRVLIIDDEPVLGAAVQRALSGENAVVVVRLASEALQRLEAGERYDVVLCDLRMPGMDGVEFHRRLKAVLPEEAGRVVFITGGVVDVRAEEFFRDAPNTLLEKPIDLDGLRALIERRVRGDGEDAAGVDSRRP
jgi:CheY-like chemotaxis protein